MKNLLNDYPVVDLGVTSKNWSDAYELGQLLEAKFPNQEASNFTAACSYNDWGPTVDDDGVFLVDRLTCLQVGEHDGRAWIWGVIVNGNRYIAEGACDYTGWDCQSYLIWGAATPLTWGYLPDALKAYGVFLQVDKTR